MSCEDITGRNIPGGGGRVTWLDAGGWPGGWNWVAGDSEGHRVAEAEWGWTGRWLVDPGSRPGLWSSFVRGEEPVEFSESAVIWSMLKNTAPSRCCVSRCLGKEERGPTARAAVLLSAITARQGGGQPWVPGNFERRGRSPVLYWTGCRLYNRKKERSQVPPAGLPL